MKKWTALILCIALLLTQCGIGFAEKAGTDPEIIYFEDFDDPELLQYMEDTVYASLAADFASDDYTIEGVRAVYISQEYLEEVAFNTQANIYFGYTLAELDAEFEGSRYVFTLGDDGETVVQEFTEFPDTTDAQILKNIAIGTGVILLCVTVSVVGGGTVSVIFAAAAKTAATMAVKEAAFSAAAAAITRGFESGDMYEAVQSARLSASEGFKIGAITGAIKGGATEAFHIYKTQDANVQPQISDDMSNKQNADEIPGWSEAEEQVALKYECSKTQVAYLNHEEVPFNTANSTRPDGIRLIDDHWEAIEVKNYNLTSDSSLACLKKELIRQVTDRCNNLPEGMTQRIVLNITERGYTEEFMTETVASIHSYLDPIYPDIPIDVFCAA